MRLTKPGIQIEVVGLYILGLLVVLGILFVVYHFTV